MAPPTLQSQIGIKVSQHALAFVVYDKYFDTFIACLRRTILEQITSFESSLCVELKIYRTTLELNKCNDFTCQKSLKNSIVTFTALHYSIQLKIISGSTTELQQVSLR